MAERSLLIEIGCEELPIHAVDDLARAFAQGVCDGLSKRGIMGDVGHAQTFATPRRLAVLVPGVAFTQPEQRGESLGPYLNIALDADGQPTKALSGFANKAGVDWTQLERATDARGERFVHRSVTPGRSTAELVPEIVREAAAALPIAKPMRWGDHDFAFVRPVHWLVALHGDQVIAGELFGVKGGRQSRGHRFMHPTPVHLVDADGYAESLRAAKVLADPVERRQRIRDEVARVAPADCEPRLDDALLDELANLNEWPVAIACTFDREYLSVPHEALVTTMRANQKFVPVFGTDGRLGEHFIGIANIESKDPAQVRHGYERVIRPRFADAKFFFDEDLKTPLARHQQGLRDVTYQKALGSLWDKTVRVAELASAIAERLFAQGIEVDAAQVAHAAGLSRCDLLTRMVGEFPELQGVMGRHYAAAQGEPAEVANALDEFYRPRNAGDGIAEGALAQCLSLADKLDTLAGIFAVGLKPTGNKDPFALRRAALGLARTLVEGGLDLDLDRLLKEALSQVQDALVATTVTRQGASAAEAEAKGVKVAAVQSAHVDLPGGEVFAALRDFILDRLRGYYAEKGFTAQQFDAVAAVRPNSLVDFDRRLRAVAAFAKQPEAEKLAAANKRVANILRKQGVDMDAAARRELDAALLREPAEQALAQALDDARRDNAARLAGDTATRDYEGALARLAQLQAPIDAFFDDVMVMVDDTVLRGNRIALLARVKARFDVIAEIALL
ncbi:MAG: glycine--tRNA ligase subunit beta [Xanthomonadales bacterium]|nr:glycine--tRNA ligase subunit beta [Xanthomonadales bacterium]ODU95079.1 MAG: glycine--tRNA ligase subunit beta [Rhodanobacter sp. SCN 66-43]OJY82178.1 MAG: glycine--tRNA ligase subunit beta [Xanthomonadales bacterium 66-474]